MRFSEAYSPGTAIGAGWDALKRAIRYSHERVQAGDMVLVGGCGVRVADHDDPEIEGSRGQVSDFATETGASTRDARKPARTRATEASRSSRRRTSTRPSGRTRS